MAYDTKVWRCGKYTLTFDRPRIMGVLNVTPDSFSDGGEHFDTDAAIAHGLAMLDAGADIIDVGGESTRPGFRPVNADEEARRVLPVVRALAAKGAVVSIDTRHVEVAKAAVRVGASIVNDVTGFTDPKMVEFVAKNTCGVIIVHAGEVSEQPARARTAVQLDTSAAAFVAERAREAEEEAAAAKSGKAKRARGKRAGKLGATFVQPQLPFGEAFGAEEKEAAPSAEAAPAAHDEVPADGAVSGQDASAGAQGADGQEASLVVDELAAVMRRSALRAEAYVSTYQPRRFTLPDSAPIMRRVMGFLSDQARALVRAGVSRDRICIDSGAGFGKSANEDVIIQRETAKMASLGYPLLCAVSRKRFIGAVSGVEEAADRDAATFGVCLGAIENGANIVRVHDVAEPAYETRQAPFANAVVEIKTELAPLVLLDELLSIENSLGRNRTKSARPNGPRVIDCDLVWMDGERHGGDKLRLPHPKLGERDFVLVPLEDLMHDPARFFRYEGVEVLEPEERMGHVVGELGSL